MTVYFVDGAFVPAEKAMIPVDDLAVLRGIGICDIMRTFHGKPYFLDEHIERLMESGEKIGLALPWTRSDIKQIVVDTLGKNPGLFGKINGRKSQRLVVHFYRYIIQITKRPDYL